MSSVHAVWPAASCLVLVKDCAASCCAALKTTHWMRLSLGPLADRLMSRLGRCWARSPLPGTHFGWLVCAASPCRSPCRRSPRTQHPTTCLSGTMCWRGLLGLTLRAAATMVGAGRAMCKQHCGDVWLESAGGPQMQATLVRQQSSAPVVCGPWDLGLQEQESGQSRHAFHQARARCLSRSVFVAAGRMLERAPHALWAPAARPHHSSPHPTPRRLSRRLTTLYAALSAAGKVTFPPQYPFKPPSIVMLTPNGRFATNTKLCLRCPGCGVGMHDRPRAEARAPGACPAAGAACWFGRVLLRCLGEALCSLQLAPLPAPLQHVGLPPRWGALASLPLLCYQCALAALARYAPPCCIALVPRRTPCWGPAVPAAARRPLPLASTEHCSPPQSRGTPCGACPPSSRACCPSWWRASTPQVGARGVCSFGFGFRVTGHKAQPRRLWRGEPAGAPPVCCWWGPRQAGGSWCLPLCGSTWMCGAPPTPPARRSSRLVGCAVARLPACRGHQQHPGGEKAVCARLAGLQCAQPHLPVRRRHHAAEV